MGLQAKLFLHSTAVVVVLSAGNTLAATAPWRLKKALHPLPALPEIRFAGLVALLVWTHLYLVPAFLVKTLNGTKVSSFVMISATRLGPIQLKMAEHVTCNIYTLMLVPITTHIVLQQTSEGEAMCVVFSERLQTMDVGSSFSSLVTAATLLFFDALCPLGFPGLFPFARF